MVYTIGKSIAAALNEFDEVVAGQRRGITSSSNNNKNTKTKKGKREREESKGEGEGKCYSLAKVRHELVVVFAFRSLQLVYR